ncbi:hypothetical protein KR009_003047 [Drosophila setifemur]|nr:hypothetical protein KR009_003047 [Drosophila setifemur]
MMEFGKSEHSLHSNSASEASGDSGSLLALTPTKRKREKDLERRKSPATSSTDNTSTSVQAPMSPSSTSSTADTTFEPTIEMMVNDFDDEGTLNEEEALADQEAHSAEDEIATLREESEMPIEELLAKYGGMAPSPATVSSSNRSGSSRRARRATKRHYQELDTEAQTSTSTSSCASQVEKSNDYVEQQQPLEEDHIKQTSHPENTEDSLKGSPSDCTMKPHRSHLLDLYPDEPFGDRTPISGPQEEIERFTPLQALFDEVEADEEEDSESDSDESRKIIMVGIAFQAEIPEGLSQYGDILPYENEDQLIWEPSQVSEREVEEYLAKIQETRSIVAPEEGAEGGAGEESGASIVAAAVPPNPVPPTPPTPPKVQQATTTGDQESASFVKDNEQALHLLVQCGYDFKEALRRKRMNVLPLSDTMSSWSEDECLKFEEGIHKFGKDFYQIRQNQVRTRTMRELVHFYYLWKKSERRDQSFALNDTIDHMDVFINEAGTGNGTGNGAGNSNGSCSPRSSNGHSNGETFALEKDPSASPRKPASKSYSIMTGGQASGAVGGSSRKRETSSSQTLEDEDIIEVGSNPANV